MTDPATLHAAGWRYGYCCAVERHGILTWLADAHRGDVWKKATGRTLEEALRKLVESLLGGQEHGSRES